MDKETRRLFNKRVDYTTEDLPWFVQEFIDKRKRKLSPVTLLNYCHDYHCFFDWFIHEGYYFGQKKGISLQNLEELSIQQIEDYLTFLDIQKGNCRSTVNRKISALKSLFNYLQNIAETKDFEPYIKRNVLAKIELNDIKEDQHTVANRINGKILRDDEFEQFRQFVSYDYGEMHKKNKKLYNFHQFNRERDTAIISLILGSGLRLSEVVGCDFEDLDMNKCLVRVIRKGNKEQFVYFSEQAKLDLIEYLKIREERYKIKLPRHCLLQPRLDQAIKSEG